MDERSDNPMGTNGFEFIEFTAPDISELDRLFRRMGFRVTARHRSKQVTLYQQGDVNFVVNAETEIGRASCRERV